MKMEKWIEIKKFNGVKISIHNVNVVDDNIVFEYKVMDESVKFDEDGLNNYLKETILNSLNKCVQIFEKREELILNGINETINETIEREDK